MPKYQEAMMQLHRLLVLYLWDRGTRTLRVVHERTTRGLDIREASTSFIRLNTNEIIDLETIEAVYDGPHLIWRKPKMSLIEIDGEFHLVINGDFVRLGAVDPWRYMRTNTSLDTDVPSGSSRAQALPKNESTLIKEIPERY